MLNHMKVLQSIMSLLENVTLYCVHLKNVTVCCVRFGNVTVYLVHFKNVTVYHVRLRKMLQSDLVPPIYDGLLKLYDG